MAYDGVQTGIDPSFCLACKIRRGIMESSDTSDKRMDLGVMSVKRGWRYLKNVPEARVSLRDEY